MSIFFTADTHFGHSAIIKYCNRPYDNFQDMDEAIISNYNKLVKPGDTVYHLGDFCFGKEKEIKYYRSRLNGKIHLILGNHDYKNKIYKYPHLFTEICDLMTLKNNKKKIILCHYAMRTWESSHHNSYQLYGHSHGLMISVGKQMDVGVDAQGFMPISIEQVIRTMLLKPDNINKAIEEVTK